MEKIVVLDFSTAETHVWNWTPADWESAEAFIDAQEETLDNSGNCQWMHSPTLKITIH